MKETNEKQSKIKNNSAMFYLIVIVLIAIIAISSTLGLYAWSKYTTSVNETATAQVAKWHFELKEGTTQTGNTLLKLTRTDGYEHVVEGLVAPGTYGELPIIIDTTTTEVDLIYDLTITINNFPQNMILTNSAGETITPTVSGEGTTANPRVATINISKYVPYRTADADRLHDETIKWNWPYQTGTSNDVIVPNDTIDTNDAGKEISVDISVTGTEVMNAPLSYSTITDSNNNVLNNGDTVNLNVGGPSTTLKTSSGTETVTYNSSNQSVATVTSSGEITPIGAGTTVITITGNETGKTIEVNVKVKNTVSVKVGDTINYSPSGTYDWDDTYATANSTTITTLSSASGQSYNISKWKVLSVDEETGEIEMVPEKPTNGTVTFQGAQGYNNAVYLLNEACSHLYGNSTKGITARSITEEDFVKVGGTTWTNYRASYVDRYDSYADYGEQKSSAYTSSNYYPSVYAQEINSVIDGTKSTKGYSQSKQESLIGRTDNNATNGYLKASKSIQPYQTYYDTSDYSTTQGLLGDTYTKLLFPNQNLTTYWIASRSVNLRETMCEFCVFYVRSGFITGAQPYRF